MKIYYCNPKTDKVTVRTNGSSHREITSHDGPNVKGRSFLLDAFGIEFCPIEPCICDNRWVDISHEAFTVEVLANLPQDEVWQINHRDVCDWVFDYVARTDVIEKELVTT